MIGKRRPRRLGLLLATLALGLGVACRQEARAAAPEGTPGDAAGFPRTVRGFERELRLEAPPRRVLPANGGAADFLLALVAPERLVALAPATRRFSVEAARHPELEARVRSVGFGTEGILALEPDLVLCHAWQDRATVELLREVGVPVLVLPEVEAWGDVERVLTTLGAVLGEEERAAARIEGLRARVRALGARPAPAARRILGYSNLGSGGSTAGRGTTFDLICGLAGLENAAAEAGLVGHARLDHEGLLALDPDWILVSGAEHEPERRPAEEYLRSQPDLAGLRALDGGVVSLPMELATTNSWHLITAAETLRERLEGR